jgi:hypothetical protein
MTCLGFHLAEAAPEMHLRALSRELGIGFRAEGAKINGNRNLSQ